MERICSKCQSSRDASAFYAGHAQCKDCVKARVRRHRAENIESIRDYDRARANLPHRVAKRREIFESYKVEQPARRKAHILARAILERTEHD